MSVSWREAEKQDRLLLEGFTCCPDGAPPYARDVQSWIRADAIRETNRDRATHDQRLLLLFDDADLVAVVSHCTWPEAAEALGTGVRLFLALAVAVGHQGHSLTSGQRSADAAIALAVEDAARRRESPRILAGRVHEQNEPSQRALRRNGFTGFEKDPHVPDHMLAIRLLG